MKRYPLPHPEELRDSLVGGAVFFKVDLADSYLQIKEYLQLLKYLVISAYRSLYLFTRISSDLNGSSVILQSAINMIMQGLPGVSAILDDILVTGKTEQEHI